MRVNIKRYRLIYNILLMGFLSSCGRWVEVEVPKSQLLGSELYKQKQTAQAALAGLYAHIRDQGYVSGNSFYNGAIPIGWYSDEIVYPRGAGNDEYLLYHNMLTPSTLKIKDLWTISYKSIYLANGIIEGAKNSLGLSEADVAPFLGEALFIRGLMHFYLTNTYGDIPYVRTTDYRENMRIGKKSLTDVLAEVIRDLSDAEGYLSETYPSTERIRVNKSVVHALMARVYLYQKDWTNAALFATKIIDQTSLYQLEDLDQVFLKGSREAIWQLKPAEEGYATKEGASYILNNNPNRSGFTLQDTFVEAHEIDDQRKDKWLGTFIDGQESWPFTFKYKQRLSTTGVTTEYSVILRLAEQFLIRAEAFAHLDRIDEGTEDLNRVRNRAGLGNLSDLDKASLLDAVLQERRIELFMEYGHRWFDLKRTGLAEQYLKPIKENWSSKQLLWPIPQSEIEANSNLEPQNPDYY